jgi:hypothetical protein
MLKFSAFTKKFDRIFSACLIGLMTIMMSLVGYWQFLDTRSPITYNDVPYTRSTVHTGDTMTVVRQFCTTREVNVKINRAIRDGVLYPLEPYEGHYKKGCYEVKVKLTIPNVLPPGYYMYDATATVNVNPLRTTQQTLQPIWFVIPNKDGSIPEFHEEHFLGEGVNTSITDRGFNVVEHEIHSGKEGM